MKRGTTPHVERGGGIREHPFVAEGDFVDRLEGTERRQAIPIETILPGLRLGSGDTVADLGAGIGYFTFPIAERVREVISIDMEQKMLEIISKRVREKNADNVQVLRGEITQLPFADSSIGHVLAAFVYHEVGSQERLIQECARVLPRSGSLSVIDFQKRKTAFGPPVKERKRPEHVLRTSRKWFRLVYRYETKTFYQVTLTRI